MSAITGPNTLLQNLVLSLDAASQRSYTSGSLVWYDVSGNGNNGTLVSGSGYSPINGGTITFNGVNNYVDFGQAANFGISQSFTVSTWFKTTYSGSNQQAIVGKSKLQTSPAEYTGYIAGMNTGTATAPDIGKFAVVFVSYPFAYPGSVMRRQTTQTYNNGLWTNATFTYNGSGNRSGILIYMNGSLSSMTDIDSSFITGSINTITNFEIGARDGAQTPFEGQVAVTQVYNRALSPEEIQQNFNSQRFRFGI